PLAQPHRAHSPVWRPLSPIDETNMEDDNKEGELLSPILLNHVQPIISAHPTGELLSRAVRTYTKLHHQCTKAKHGLENFKLKCTHGGGVLRLPRSCGIQWDKLLWPTLPDDPSFCKEEKEAIVKLSQETNQKVYDQLLSAKQKYIKHLDSNLNMDTFVKAEADKYSTTLNEYLKLTLATRHLPPPPDADTFPIRNDAVSKYQQ